MNRHTVTQRLVYYIRDNHIPVERIQADLGIPEGKLQYREGEELTASEFLSLCQYLNIHPEHLKCDRDNQ